MMPVKEILGMQHLETKPPILVIDETTIKCTSDVGPICGCNEKYEIVKKYKPFIPGGVNPYNRRKIPESECLEIFWKRLKIGMCDLIFDQPQAVHQCEIPENASLSDNYQPKLVLLTRPECTGPYPVDNFRE